MQSFLKFVGLTLLSAAVCSVAMAQKMEHNAYLRKPVFSKAELISQLEDPIVLKRYEKHFKMGKSDLTRRFGEFRMGPLLETRRYMVYNIDPKYVIRKRYISMKRGTLAFFDRNGKPVMKRSCGNPMVAFLPPVGRVATAMTPPAELPLEAAEQPEVFASLVPPVEDMAETAIVPSMSSMESTSSEGALMEVVPPAPTPPVAVPPILPVVPGLPFWPFLGLLAPAFIGSGGGGTVPPPVPEPASMLVFGAGIAAVAARRRRRNK
ncbi:MAG: PEP-CTERM sorting domain-containing protein [Fimbriimonadaceae bacterium]|nr:PEP-CTERM sorting domain-containing protein [Fimbriimonadaceae bacterium]